MIDLFLVIIQMEHISDKWKPGITLFVVTPEGKTLVFRVPRSSTLQFMKMSIEKKYPISWEYCYLVGRGGKLLYRNNLRLLEDYGMTNESNIYMKIRGPSPDSSSVAASVNK